MKLEFDFRKFGRSALTVLGQYRIIITSALLLAVGGFVLLRINELTQTEVDTNYKNQRLSEINRVEFDQESIEAITRLDSSDVDVTSDFTDRNNPFTD